jgi:hypothetical protein
MMYCGLQLSMKVNEYQQPRDPNSNFQVRKKKGKKARQWQTKPPPATPAIPIGKGHEGASNEMMKGQFWLSGGTTHTVQRKWVPLTCPWASHTHMSVFFKTKVSLSWLLNYKKLLWKNKKAIWSRLKFLYFNGIFIILLCIIIFY